MAERSKSRSTIIDVEKVLMQVVEEFAAFLQFNKPDELAPGVAQWGKERLRSLIDQLSPSEKASLADFLGEQHAHSTGEYRTWIAGLPSQLGLVSEP
jgi:hypothetical protein